ncbi:MAG: GldG family protein [Treponema sp.]|nr:GldG family protein [Treponema sp.]
MTRRQAAVLCTLSLALLCLGFLLSRRLWFRLDLTADHAHTLSAVSRNLRDEISPGEELRITYYISGRLAAMDPMPAEIEDMLREYVSWSGGKIRLNIRNPAQPDIAAEAERLGVVPRQISTVEQDQAGVATVYTGIVIEYLDRYDVLPVVFSLNTLEYDLTSRIRSLLRGTERQIGVLVGDSYRQWNVHYQPPAMVLNQSGYRVRLFQPGEEIPASLPALLVLGGAEDLDPRSLYRIDWYIQNGGKVLFALEGVFVDSEGALDARIMEDRGLLAMVSFYGATVQPELALDRSARTLQYQMQAPNGSLYFRTVLYPHWFGILAENVNALHPVTADFSGLDLYWPSHLSLNPPEGVTAEVLLSGTPEGWVLKDDFATNPELGREMERMENRGRQIFGLSLSGTFPSWFRGLPKPRQDGETSFGGNLGGSFPEGTNGELPDLPAAAAPSRIIVVSDTDMITGLLNYTTADYNLDFLIKALDWLGNDDELIAIRGRSGRIGRLDKISDPLRKLSVMGFAQGLNVVFLPLALVGAGLLFARQRRRQWRRHWRSGKKRGSDDGA